MSRTVLVTGAGGFVGQAVASVFAAAGWRVNGTSRQPRADASSGLRWWNVPEGAAAEHWRAVLEGVDVVVHCAARVHVMRDTSVDPMTEFRQANVQATLALAGAAQAAGVKRLVFLSTIGVNGARTQERPFRADDPPAPHSPYAVSKWEAEQQLFELGRVTGLEVVAIRPPLVYGPQAPGNFGRLVAALQRGLPLPLASIRNSRSLVAVGNLASLVKTCSQHASAPGKVFLAADGEDLSTPELLRRLGQALGRPARLLPLPTGVLRTAARMAGRSAMFEQLCGNLQVDATLAHTVLGWRPPFSVAQGLQAVAARPGSDMNHTGRAA